jgi:hypothetical protein
LIDDADEEGAVQKPKMRLTSVRLLADAQIAKMSWLRVDLRASNVDENVMKKISDLMKNFPGEKPVHLNFVVDDMDIELKLPRARAVKPIDELIMALEESVKEITVRRE